MKPKAIFCFFLLIPLISFSQGEFNNWYFGVYSSVTFNYGAPQVMPPNAMTQVQQVGNSVSDSAGNIVFYSDGYFVYNRNNVQMPNGYGLAGIGCCVQLSSVPSLKNKHEYYIFTVQTFLPSFPVVGLHYSVLDMQLDGGNGDIVIGKKNIPLPMGDSARHELTATRHQNNKDAWVVTYRQGRHPQYLAYLIDSTGVHTTPVISSSTMKKSSSEYKAQYMRISPDGNYLVCSDSVMEVCTFDKSTGIVTPKFTCRPGIIGPNWLMCDWGKEFSIDSRFLYAGATDGTISNSPVKLYQYDMIDLDSLAFMHSQVKIFDSVGWSMQMAPDGKIYINNTDDFFLDAINNPSVKGPGCNFQPFALTLTDNHYQCLPQFLQRYKAYIHYTKKCIIDTVHFSPDIWPPPDSIHWDFGDPASGLNNFSNLASPEHLYVTPGSHTVELWVRHNDKRTDTTWVTVNVPALPNPQLGANRTICTGNTVTFDAGACTNCTFLWTNLSTGMSAGTSQTLTTGIPGLYEVVVTDTNGCHGLDTVQLSTTPVPVLTNNPAAKTICSGESTQISLTSDLPGANFYWTASLTSGTVTGFTPDSGLVINQTLINTGAAVGVVTYHITPKIGDCAGIPVDYLVTVNVGNPVGVSIAATGNNICAGTQVTFTATPTNPGNSPVYQWKINAINVINANSAVYTYTPVNGDCVTCQLTSDIVCSIGNPALSNSICMIVDPMLPVSVTVTTPLTAVCAGASVTFTANPTHGGTLPMYQWKVNTLNVSGATNSTFTYVPLNGDIVTCQLTSSDNCVTGNPALSPPVTMTVNQNLEVTVSITASSNPFCAGSQVTFIAVPGHGGLVPGYQWKVNAINMINANNASYAYNAVAGDVVTCEMTSSESCVSGNPALSNAITMSVNTNLPAGVSISTPTNPFCLGTLVTFTATPVNGGSMSAYQWKVNAINVNNAINAGFTYNSLPGDVVSCVMTSNLNCVTGNPVTSAPIVMIERVGPAVSFTACFDTITTVNAKPIKLKGGLPPGGQYSGPGVNTTTGIFKPSEVGTGLKTISYSYTNVYTCGTSKTRTILVQPAPAFICGNNLTDIRDNRVYATVLIGLQCWMKENLDFGFGISDLVPQTDNCVAEKFLRYSIFNIRYSTFYQWDELMRYDPTPASQGLCPPGWHVPTSSEWDQLVLFCNGPGQAGGPMKDSLLVNGFQSHQQGFLYLNNTWAFTSGNTAGTMYWTSTASGAARAVARGLNEYNLSVSRYEAARGNAFSVRCLKD